MSKQDNTTMLAMINAIQAQLDAMKAMLSAPETTNCTHNDMVTIQTMGGVQGGFCNDCGAEFVMGVLDKDENNE